MKINIIDCTIRDGGLLNNWCFDDKTVRASYFAAEKGKVDYFEIGYKNDPNKTGLGPYGYCDDKFISSLFKGKSDNLKLLCMIDAGKYTDYFIPECKPELTPFDGIRVASYPYEVEKAIKLVEKFHDKGYEVFLQLMASSEWLDEQYEILKSWKKKYILKAVYFADSFGSFLPQDIPFFVNKLKELGFKDIGFHAHNNLQMAFANALEAIKAGATYIDATIYGMGRGSGNLPIEVFLSYLNKIGQSQYNVVPYLSVIERFYIGFTKDFQWGYSLKSLFGGIKNIHPYYIGELFKLGYYTADEIWNLLDHIKRSCPISFSSSELSSVLDKRGYSPTAIQAREVVERIERENKIFFPSDSSHLQELVIENRHKGRNFIIIANGPSAEKYHKEIGCLIDKDNLISIGCNYLKDYYEPDYHLFVNRKRFLKYISTVNKKSSLVVPTFFGKDITRENYDRAVEYIEITSSNDITSSPIDGIKQRQVYLNVAISAILMAFQMGAKEIMVVGMDGYENESSSDVLCFYNEDDQPDDKATASVRYKDLSLELERVSNFLNENGVSFSIITPTSHGKYYKDTLNFKKYD